MSRSDTDSNSENEDNEYVVFGTRIEENDNTKDANAGQFKKPAFMEDRVLNERGRALRFHGAFTGGFSAGYFNTVGSKEGFCPVSFKSNRSDKAALKRNLPEDYMDEEDFSEHGIAPRRIKAAFQFDDSEARRLAQTSFLNSLIPDEGNFLKDILMPLKLTIGMKLLRKLGWREAVLARRGISKDSSVLPQEEHGTEVIQSIEYVGKISEQHPIEETTAITFTPKPNTMGLGYSGINSQRTDVLSVNQRNKKELLGFNPDGRSLRVGIRGKGFSVGALESEDVDIYATDDMSNYDWSVDAANDNKDEEDDKFGWTAPSQIGSSPSKKVQAPAGYVGHLLPGFIVQMNCLTSTHSYAPPSLPPNYKPRYGAFMSPQTVAVDQPANKEVPTQSTTSSVFDLVSAADRSRLLALQCKNPPPTDNSQVHVQHTKPHIGRSVCGTGVIVSDSRFLGYEEKKQLVSVPENAAAPRRWDRGAAPKQSSSVPVVEKTSESLECSSGRQFGGNSNKLARYQLFVNMKKSGVAALQTKLFQHSTLTEWEKAQEIKEFELVFHKEQRGLSDSSEASRPLISSHLAQRLASRFTSGGVHGGADKEVTAHGTEVVNELPGGIISKEEFIRREKLLEPSSTQVTKSDKEQAAEIGMYGSVTRSIEKWHPGRILCRRFNVPDPYPESDITGVPKTKRDKFSVFDFLEDAGSAPQPPVTEMIPNRSSLLPNASNPTGLSVEEKRKNLFSVLFQEPQQKEPSADVSEAKKKSVEVVESQMVKLDTERTVENELTFIIDTQPTIPDIVPEKTPFDDEERPPIDLFKTIFASDEETSSDEDMKVAPKSHPFENHEECSSWKAPINPHISSEGVEEDLTYGPQLPPTLDDNPMQTSSNLVSETKYLSIEEYSKELKKVKKSKHKKAKKKDKKAKHKHVKDS